MVSYRLMVIALSLGFSASLSLLFLLLATLLGSYSTRDVMIGLAWFFTISLILSSPIFIPRVRRRYK